MSVAAAVTRSRHLPVLVGVLSFVAVVAAVRLPVIVALSPALIVTPLAALLTTTPPLTSRS